MKVELSPKAAKYLKALNEPHKSRLKSALEKLSNEPPTGDIRTMSGHDEYRLRVGNYRLLFKIFDEKILVHEIGVRGQIYKR
jgi:mRNA interferase RelE/StbE